LVGDYHYQHVAIKSWMKIAKCVMTLSPMTHCTDGTPLSSRFTLLHRQSKVT